MDEEKNHMDILRNDMLRHGTEYKKQTQNDPKTDAAFHQLIGQMKLSTKVEQEGEAMKPYILQRVNKRINQEQKRRRMMWISAVVASIAVLFGISNSFSYLQGFKKVNSQLIEMTNPLGMLSTITLSDGSKVILNAGSTLTYPNAFVSQNREVTLKGEGYFQVAHKADHPFVVNADNVMIHVLGTEFNVKAYEEDDRIEVSLVKGKVGVLINNRKGFTFLDSGQQAYYDKRSDLLTRRQVNVTHYVSWKDGNYYFRALPLKEIVNQLARIFNIDIQITSTELEDIIITGDFLRGENPEQILRVMTADKRLKYRIEEDVIYIEKR